MVMISLPPMSKLQTQSLCFRNHPSIIVIKIKKKIIKVFLLVTPAYKKKPKNPKDNYRPVLMLSNISQIYEKCIYD